jgi:zinc resistance-associated protein
MNTRNISIAAMAAFLVLGMTAMAFAGPGYGRGAGVCTGPGYGQGYGQGNAYGQLAPEKQKAVEVIFEKYDAKFDDLRTQMWTKRSVLQAMINGGNADEKKIAGLASDLNKLRDQMRDTRLAMNAELEKETGLVGFGRGFGRGFGPGSGNCPGFNDGRGYGRMGPGYGHMGSGYGRMGNGPGMGYGYGMTN